MAAVEYIENRTGMRNCDCLFAEIACLHYLRVHCEIDYLHWLRLHSEIACLFVVACVMPCLHPPACYPGDQNVCLFAEIDCLHYLPLDPIQHLIGSYVRSQWVPLSFKQHSYNRSCLGAPLSSPRYS